MDFKSFFKILLIAAMFCMITCYRQPNRKLDELAEEIGQMFSKMYTDSFPSTLKQKMTEYADELKKVSTVKDPTSEAEAETFLQEAITKFNNIKKLYSKEVHSFQDVEEAFDFVNETRPNFHIFAYKDFQNEKLRRQYRFFIERALNIFDLNMYGNPLLALAMADYGQEYPVLDKYVNIEPEEYKNFWINERKRSPTDNLIIHGWPEILLSLLRGYDHPSLGIASKYSTENYFDKVKSVLEELRPFYVQLHAYVRHALQTKYGKEIVSDNGPIPHYLIEQLEIQSKFSGNFDYPFAEKGFPIVMDSLKKDGLSIKDVAKKCDKFFQSVGFPELPEKFWEKNFHISSDVDYDVNTLLNGPQESLLEVGGHINFKTYLQMCTNLAKIHYDELTRNYSTSYMGEPYPGYTRSVGKAIRLSVLSPEYLNKFGFLADDKIDEETNLNRLYRMAIQSVFGMSQFYVYEKFWYNFMDITTKTNNCDYWKLENDFRGVEPSTHRTSNNFDVNSLFFSSKEYILDIMKQNRYSPIFENILGHSIYKYLCIKSGEYIPGDEEHPLNKCNFYGNKEAGKFLISSLSSDPSNYWYEILEKVYGDDVGLDASGILEYFKPLIEWLEKENKKNNVFIGWEESLNKCDVVEFEL